MSIFIKFLNYKPFQLSDLEYKSFLLNSIDINNAKRYICDLVSFRFNILLNEDRSFFFKINCLSIHDINDLIDVIKSRKNNFIEVQGKLFGGKGGFGSLLKKQKATKKIKKNLDSCKTLDGRRLRDVNIEKSKKNAIIKKIEEENLINKYLNPSENKVFRTKDSRNINELNKNNEEDLEMEKSFQKSISYLKNKRLKNTNKNINDRNIISLNDVGLNINRTNKIEENNYNELNINEEFKSNNLNNFIQEDNHNSISNYNIKTESNKSNKMKKENTSNLNEINNIENELFELL